MWNARLSALVEILGKLVQQNRYCTLKFALRAILGIKVKLRSADMLTLWGELKSLSESALPANKRKKSQQRQQLQSDENRFRQDAEKNLKGKISPCPLMCLKTC